MPLNYFYSYTEAARAEEELVSMAYAELVESLPRLADLGVLVEGAPVAMLVAARLVDRARIAGSGIRASELRRVLEEYSKHPNAVPGVAKALEAAVRIAGH